MAYIPFFFFFNDTATTEIYTLSLHDALPIYFSAVRLRRGPRGGCSFQYGLHSDRKSTRLNSSHSQISYAVFCLKKKTRSHLHARSSSADVAALLTPALSHPRHRLSRVPYRAR